MVTTLLFTSGAAIVIVEGFVKSFQAVGTSLPRTTPGSLAQTVTGDVVTFFAAAVEIAAPVIVVLFCTQILLALLAKAAPQINVFVFGMPLQMPWPSSGWASPSSPSPMTSSTWSGGR